MINLFDFIISCYAIKKFSSKTQLFRISLDIRSELQTVGKNLKHIEQLLQNIDQNKPKLFHMGKQKAAIKGIYQTIIHLSNVKRESTSFKINSKEIKLWYLPEQNLHTNYILLMALKIDCLALEAKTKMSKSLCSDWVL